MNTTSKPKEMPDKKNVEDKTGSKEFKGMPKSFWIETTGDTDYPKVDSDMEVDVAIVGGGITGLTAAYLLKKQGAEVAVIDANRIAKGVSGHTTAKITSQHHLKYTKIIKAVGKEKARQYADANQAAIDLIENIVREHNIDCGFKRLPAYVYTQDDKYLQKIEDEIEAASSLGLPAAFADSLGLPFKIKGAMKFSYQAQFHPRKYLLSLASLIEGEGCAIFEQTRIVDIIEGTPHILVADNGRKIRAKNIIQATRYPFYDKPGLYFSRLYPQRSYLMAIRMEGNLPEGMFISAEDPPRTMRSYDDNGSCVVLVGGENHKTGHGKDLHKHYETIRDFAESNFNVKELLCRWSAQDYTSMDEIPFAGRMTSGKDSIYVATGFDKWGITNGTASAMIISDLILKGGSPWEEVYSPSRLTPVASAKNFIVENADVAKNFISGKLNIPDGTDDVGKNEAVITEVGGFKVGMYRDNDGELHFVSTTCTHLGCELKWNSAELSWDCPCHGSRFTYTGDIIEGPALEDIKPKEMADNPPGPQFPI